MTHERRKKHATRRLANRPQYTSISCGKIERIAQVPWQCCMKGRKLPDTTLSRTIIIEMKRKLPNETVVDFDHLDDDDLTRLRRQLARWADDNGSALTAATPEIPPGFHNRVRANWKLLLAIAENAGNEWKRAAWQAAG